MAKEPVAGRVKTRLAQDIGAARAAAWYRGNLNRLCRSLHSPKWDISLAVAPDRAISSRMFPNLPRQPQGTGDLGPRMARLLRGGLPGPVLVIGSDIIGVSQRDISTCFGELETHSLIFAASPDGGFWAVGARGRHLPQGLFQGVRWSSKDALADSVESAGTSSIGYGPMRRDVDRASDLPISPDLPPPAC